MSAKSLHFLQAVFDAWEDRGLTQPTAIEDAGGPSTETVRKWRLGLASGEGIAEPKNPTWMKVENSTGWPGGTARQVWRGAPAPRPQREQLHAREVLSAGGRSLDFAALLADNTAHEILFFGETTAQAFDSSDPLGAATLRRASVEAASELRRTWSGIQQRLEAQVDAMSGLELLDDAARSDGDHLPPMTD